MPYGEHEHGSVVWSPHPGPQSHLLSCPIEDVLYGGARGGGKTDGLLGVHLQQQLEYPEHAKGLFLRRSYPEIEEAVARSRQIFDPLGWRYREKDRTWFTGQGGFIRMRFIDRDVDAAKYQGHSYSCITPDEAGSWADPTALDMLFGCLRSPHGVPCLYRASANPGGAGHGWLRQRYIDPAPPNTPFEAELSGGATRMRCFIPSKVTDNPSIMLNDPGYVNRLKAVGSEALVEAWLNGNWNVTLGQYFTEWNRAYHVIPDMDIPRHWMKFRAMDWGSKTPFCVLWLAVADGRTRIGDYLLPEGCLVVYREWYGAKFGTKAADHNKGLDMTVEDIAFGILSRTQGENIAYSMCDSDMMRTDGGPSRAERMQRAAGIVWQSADKERVAGWDQLRARLRGTNYGTKEWQPMVLIMANCVNVIRTLPEISHDPDKPEDALKSRGIEDHCADTLRYAVMSRPYVKHKGALSRAKDFTLDLLFKQQKVKGEERLRGY